MDTNGESDSAHVEDCKLYFSADVLFEVESTDTDKIQECVPIGRCKTCSGDARVNSSVDYACHTRVDAYLSFPLDCAICDRVSAFRGLFCALPVQRLRSTSGRNK